MGAGLRVPTPQQAHETLVQALQEQASWEQRARTAKELLKELLTSRREAADLAAQYDTRYNSLFCSVVRLFLPLLSLPFHQASAYLHAQDAYLHLVVMDPMCRCKEYQLGNFGVADGIRDNRSHVGILVASILKQKVLHWAKLVSICTILMTGIKVGEVLSMAMCDLLFSWC